MKRNPYPWAKDIGLDKAIYSRSHESWVRDCLAMIVGRLIYQGSKLVLSQATTHSALWSLCGSEGPIDVNEHCYAPMDRLLERQHAIEKHLTGKHLTNRTLILYDITSSYFEGEYADSKIVQFGYNRDHKSDHEQMVIGLITTAEGCPVCVEIFAGNTQDASTVIDKIRELRVRHGIEDFVFVGDRGMITASNETKLGVLPASDGIKIISALTHLEIVRMLARTGNAPDLFDQHRIVEITDPDDPSRRYCLCRNPLTAQRETTTRRELLERTRTEMERIAATALKSRKTKRPASDKLVGARVGTALAKSRMGKYVNWQMRPDGILDWRFDEEQIAADQALDGCYVIKTSVAAEAMTKDQAVASYKGLSRIEQAFRNLKTVSLAMRPVYHKTDGRIRAHVFLCMLAYYLQWHLTERLAPLLDEQRDRKLRNCRSRSGSFWWCYPTATRRIPQARL
jgi:transposase